MIPLRLILLWLVAIVSIAAAPAGAQTPFAQRAKELPDLLAGKIDPQTYFAPSFLAAVPQEQVAQLTRQLVAQNGPVQGVEGIRPTSDLGGDVDIAYERALVHAQLAVSPASPNKVIGLLITAVEPRGDGVAKLDADIRGLPGTAGLLIARIDAVRPPILSVNSDAQFAIGSEFKLWVLAEAARQVATKQRRWTDVIPLGPPSLPSGITQSWPSGSPLTMHSLATLMISISDNTATDTLLRVLGRSNVDAIVRTSGHSQPGRTLPILTTIEAFSLKMKAAGDLRQALLEGSEASNRRLLEQSTKKLSLATMDKRELAEGPRYIDSIEWFASPADIARTLNWLRMNGGKEALGILSINRPLGPGSVSRFGYVGYKGGSETGVIAMSYLIQSKSGDWYAVSGSWNNMQAAVDQNRFEALMVRAVALVP
jgi:Beta-lactamase enzyme family